jgi:hypothetical protein
LSKWYPRATSETRRSLAKTIVQVACRACKSRARGKRPLREESEGHVMSPQWPDMMKLPLSGTESRIEGETA